jgi:hypothetical protein
MRRCLVAAVWTVLCVGPPTAGAAVPATPQGFALADDTYFVWPSDPQGFRATAEDWYGEAFRDLGPKAFRFQILWNADPTLIQRARLLADYVRSQGVETVVATFKKNGPPPDPAAYGASTANIVAQLADRVDAWGPANEPNLGDTWLSGATGALTLAAYWAQFSAAVDRQDPTALKLSPEFADSRDLGSIGTYVDAYANAGGGFGDVVGWHAYWGTHATTDRTTDDLLDHVPPGLPVWITEVGAFGTNAHRNPPIEDSARTQDRKLDWLVNDPRGLARHPRVARVFLYHLRDTGQPDWDSALVNQDGSRRPAWYTWCYAGHGEDPGGCARWRFLGGVLPAVQRWLRESARSAG